MTSSGACGRFAASMARRPTSSRSSPTGRGARSTPGRTRPTRSRPARMSSRWRTVSDRVSTPDRPDVHSLMPAFLFAGNGDHERGRCTGCTSSATATASTPSTGARSSAVPRTRRAPAGRSRSPRASRNSGSARVDPQGRRAKATRSPSTRPRSRRRRRLPALPARARRPPPATSLPRRTRTPRPRERRSTSGIATGSRAAVTTTSSSRSRSSRQDGKLEYRETELPQDACQGTLESQARPRVRQEQRRRHADRAGHRAVARRATAHGCDEPAPRSTGLRS